MIFFFNYRSVKKGLWNMKVYDIFDSTRDGQVSFLEFLYGIYQFTKADLDTRVGAIFRLYLFPGNTKIDQKHFLMMLYNFPYKDLKILFQDEGASFGELVHLEKRSSAKSTETHS